MSKIFTLDKSKRNLLLSPSALSHANIYYKLFWFDIASLDMYRQSSLALETIEKIIGYKIWKNVLVFRNFDFDRCIDYSKNIKPLMDEKYIHEILLFIVALTI